MELRYMHTNEIKVVPELWASCCPTRHRHVYRERTRRKEVHVHISFYNLS